jgi:hypothetical protein
MSKLFYFCEFLSWSDEHKSVGFYSNLEKVCSHNSLFIPTEFF